MHLDTTKILYSPMNAQVLPNSANIHIYKDTTYICSHITTELITHRCTIIDCFNKV